jgi:hypothetical protein
VGAFDGRLICPVDELSKLDGMSITAGNKKRFYQTNRHGQLDEVDGRPQRMRADCRQMTRDCAVQQDARSLPVQSSSPARRRRRMTLLKRPAHSADRSVTAA